MKGKGPDNETIAAAASPPGRGAIGIIRISGPEALEVAARVFKGGRDPRSMAGFTASLGWIEAEGGRIDEALCLVMRGPKSFTREDVAELHCHGGPVPLKRALEAVIASGARPAAPGEFTRRAFLAGRIDLVQAEAVADLIASETEAAARAAAAQLEGALSQRLSGLRRNLAELLALIEAGIDFADEEDMTAIAKEELDSRLRQAAAEIAGLLKDAARGRRLREGARVVIAGSVNVGKSTLMNALLGRERVIVTASPGTTRDVVEDGLDIMGLPVRLFDTAGIRTGSDEVEQMGVDRARAALASGDLAVLVLDGGRPLADDDRVIAGSIPGPMVAALNKRDLPLMVTDAEIEDLARGAPVVKISALFGEGLEELEREIARALTAGATGTETPALTNARHAQALGLCAGAIERARTAARQGLSHEFMAADLRIALDHLGEITGETAAEEILDLIFSRFCIGK